jgi:hypothetical protein
MADLLVGDQWPKYLHLNPLFDTLGTQEKLPLANPVGLLNRLLLGTAFGEACPPIPSLGEEASPLFFPHYTED